MIEQPVQFETLSAKDFTSIVANLTAANINLATINSMQVNSVTATNLYVQNLTADYFVITKNTGITFSVNENSKAFHFDTTVGPLSAILPKTLPIGFNVSLYNVGNNTINLSSDGPINTPGNSKINNTPYTGMFIYKAASPDGLPPEGVFYGVGIFD
jgi:hypothetical protein